MPADSWDGLYAAIAGAFSGGGVSWLLTYLSERKQGRLSAYRQIESHLDGLQVQGVAYWKASGMLPEAESALISRLEMLDLAVQSFCRTRKEALDSYSERMDALDEIATGGEFQTVGRRRDLTRVVRLREESQKFKDELYRHC
jgi:hypothetical protein